MKTRTLAAIALGFFSLTPVAFAGTVTAGGGCANGTGDCVSGLICVNEMCVDPSSGTQSATGGIPGSLGSPTNIPSSGSLGQPSNTGDNVTLINPLKAGTSLSSFLTNILQFVIRIGSIIVILMLVYVGYLFVVAQGNESKITEARNALLWTVVGALVLLGAQVIAAGIQATVQALGG